MLTRVDRIKEIASATELTEGLIELTELSSSMAVAIYRMRKSDILRAGLRLAVFALICILAHEDDT